jgi:tRNA A-37 threonylcarbamoyl transferase component Bud32
LVRLAERDLTWAPRFLGIDGDREVLSWLPGQTIDDWWDRPDSLDELTRAVRQLHDVTAPLADSAECLVHDDLQPRNVVVDGDRIGLIDWEQLRPGRRVEDVAQLCWSFTSIGPGAEVEAVGRRWRQVLDIYGLNDRADVVSVAVAKIERCIDDILRAADLGSARHQRLEARGDHEDLAQIKTWIETNRVRLGELIGPVE